LHESDGDQDGGGSRLKERMMGEVALNELNLV
jgi:hypothetical protein